jgi:hypothetical protein
LKAKIIDVLKNFSNEDCKKFADFIESEYFNKSKILCKFYKLLIKFKPDYSDSDLTKKTIFHDLYPGKPYNEMRMLNLLSGLYKLSEVFISIESFKKEPLAVDKFMLGGMNERKLNKFFKKNYRNIKNKIKNTVLHDEPYFKWGHEIEYEYYSFLSQNDPVYYLDKEPIMTYLNKYNEYFIFKSLLNYHNIYNTSYYYDLNFEIPFIENILQYIELQGIDKNPAISIQYNILMLIKERKEVYYYKLKELMTTHPCIMSRLDTLNTYIVLFNFCISQWNDTYLQNKFVNETFNLYKHVIENRIYKYDSNAYMSHTFYYNSVQSGLAVKEYTWTEEFINKYSSELENKHKVFAYNLCYATYYFSIKNFEKSLDCLIKMDRRHSYFNMKINSLILQNYYEMNLFENAFSHIDSYRHFLKENASIKEQNKKREINFLNIFNNLLKIKSGTNKICKNDLDKMKNLGNTAYNKWLFEKISELERNVK